MSIEFFKLLFEPGEQTCFGADPYAVKVSPASEPFGEFFAINPLKEKRNDRNVTAYRNFLFEIDNSDWTVDKQIEFVTQTKALPISSAVYSGGKSIHFIISLTQPVSTRGEYDQIWRRVYEALDREPDQTVKNPSRFSRVPGAIRDSTGSEQRLLFLGGRIPNRQLDNWLLLNGIPILPETIRRERTVLPPGFKGILSRFTEQFIHRGAAEGQWNVELFKSSCDAFRNNYSIDEWRNVLGIFLPPLDANDTKTINSAWSAINEE